MTINVGDFQQTGNPIVVASVNLTLQGADIASLINFVTQAEGLYDIFAYCVVTRAATTSSSTPVVNVTYIDQTTGVSNGPIAMLAANAGNTLGAGGSQTGPEFYNCAKNTVILVSTSGFASVGATSMQFSIGAKLVYLGTGL